ncbi:Os03g0860050 [Oryza sativa Japonica Group]|jgi:hypothetical protein|uniref:Os03g0860050 protein n=1 Tax=Oryza sativa subsp. japonica TaxID=39947 RepID=C7IZL9_ORYSJ|nr:Os03g0860050 [Oryza sativa Japonica Group]|eukprot:NP_001173727.1 Os03g0860050 [Oryza sativa Japonica Group]
MELHANNLKPQAILVLVCLGFGGLPRANTFNLVLQGPHALRDCNASAISEIYYYLQAILLRNDSPDIYSGHLFGADCSPPSLTFIRFNPLSATATS